VAERTVTPDRLAVELTRIGSVVLPEIGRETLAIAMEELFVDAAKLSPKGSLATSPHPGKSAASHKASTGRPAFANLPDQSAYPRLGITEVLPASNRMRQTEESGYITWAARTDGARRGYTDILEMGRHVDSLGRMAGSEQAPEGVYGPSLERLAARAGAIITKAISAVLRRRGYAGA
jgi:hypothetical protein